MPSEKSFQKPPIRDGVGKGKVNLPAMEEGTRKEELLEAREEQPPLLELLDSSRWGQWPLRGVITRVHPQSCSPNIRIKRSTCLEISGITFLVSYPRNAGTGVGGPNFKSKMKVLSWPTYFSA